MEILTPPDVWSRICPSARQCGGCQLQALPMKNSWNLMADKVRGHLKDRRLCQSVYGTHYLNIDKPVPLPQQSTVSGGTEQGWKIVTGFLCRTHPQHYRKQGHVSFKAGIRRTEKSVGSCIDYMETYDISRTMRLPEKGLIRHMPAVTVTIQERSWKSCIVANGSMLPRHQGVKALREILGLRG